MFRLWGSRFSGCPFRYASSSEERILSWSLSLSARSRAPSSAMTAPQISAALPKPTTRGTGTVPERIPRSWPPPSILGAVRPRGSPPPHHGPVRPHGELGSRVPLPLEPLAHVEAGPLLDGRRHDVRALLPVHLRHALDGQVDRLGPAGGEDDFLRVPGADQPGHLLPGLVGGGFRLPAAGVGAGPRGGGASRGG